MKRFIAFSGGVESTTMCVLYGAHATPIFTDTRYEHKRMYERLSQVEKALQKMHGEQFQILRIQARNVESTGTDSLPDYIRLRKFYPNHYARFCTRLFKIEPMDDFLKSQGDCEVLIGLNADEEDERVGNYGKCKNVSYRYPLIEDGINRESCEGILKSHGLLPNFPPYMRRGGCIGCFFKGKKEYEIMATMAPEEADLVADLEDSIQDSRGEHYHIQGSIPNMRAFINRVRSQPDIAGMAMDESEISNRPQGTGCGVFCHR